MDQLTYLQTTSIKYWESVRHTVMGQLRMADALLARYSDPIAYDFQIQRLRGEVGERLRVADAATVLSDPHIISMVRQLFGERGVQRLKDRATTQTQES